MPRSRKPHKSVFDVDDDDEKDEVKIAYKRSRRRVQKYEVSDDEKTKALERLNEERKMILESKAYLNNEAIDPIDIVLDISEGKMILSDTLRPEPEKLLLRSSLPFGEKMYIFRIFWNGGVDEEGYLNGFYSLIVTIDPIYFKSLYIEEVSPIKEHRKGYNFTFGRRAKLHRIKILGLWPPPRLKSRSKRNR
ncbi:MAG: hypothetical protein ACW98Y_20575 [Candidatus Thorarchaeota archaeon]|jgi:hypothetical protein